jgi:hypothetical protein
MTPIVQSRPADTDPDAYDLQFELLRRVPLARRVQLALGLSDQVSRLSRRALRRMDPSATQEELDLRLVGARYGDELACAVRADLARRRAGRARGADGDR